MIVLNDSTARRIANCLSVMGAGTLEKAGELAAEELIKALDPMPDPCAVCKHSEIPGWEDPCNECVYNTRVKCGFEAKP